MQLTEFNQLIPEIKSVIEFLSAAIATGVVGNRADSWFMSLYYHQRKRLINWVSAWKMSDEDRQLIENDEDVKILFSQVTATVADEIFNKKLLLWPTITESLLRNKNFEFNEKQYFINQFMKLDPFAIHYLAKLEVDGAINVEKVFPTNKPEFRPELGSDDFPLFLGQLQNSANGLMAQRQIGSRSEFMISKLGSRFLDFISNSSLDKINEMAQS